MKNLLLIFVCLFSVSLLTQEVSSSTKTIASKNCTVKVVENCSAAPLIIFNCSGSEGFKCVDRKGSFHQKFANIETEFKSVKMTINLHSGIVGDGGRNTPVECKSSAQDCVDIVIQ